MTSNYKGVTFVKSKKNKPWLARLTIRGVTHEGGNYETEEEAAGAYNSLLILYREDMMNKYPDGRVITLTEARSTASRNTAEEAAKRSSFNLPALKGDEYEA